MIIRRGRLAALACVAGTLTALAVAGCSATSRPATSSAGPSTVGPSRSSAAPSSSAPRTSAPHSSASHPPPSRPSTSASTHSRAPATTSPPPSPTSSAAPPPLSTCHDLTIRVLLGSGAPGYEFAALQFVNAGRSACTLVGVPTVTLARQGAMVGSVSSPSSTHAPYVSYHLAPGATAESKLKDFSGCNAPLSDTITVRAPGSTVHSTRPGELRACRLIVYPLGAPQ